MWGKDQKSAKLTTKNLDGEDMDATQAVVPGSPTQQDDMDATQVS